MKNEQLTFRTGPERESWEENENIIRRNDGIIRERTRPATRRELGREYRIVQELTFQTADGQSINLLDMMPKGWEIWEFYGADEHPNAGDGIISLPTIYSEYRCRRVPNNEPLPPTGEAFEEREGRPIVIRRTFDKRTHILDEKITANDPFFLGEDALPILLHEFGHTWCEPSSIQDRRERSRLDRESKRWDIDITPSDKDIKLYKELVLGEERQAWAWTIKTMRNLRRQGIDLAPGLKNLESLRQKIHRERLLPYTVLIERLQKNTSSKSSK